MLSIVMPVYSASELMRQMAYDNVDLIRERTKAVHELIIIDNGSPHPWQHKSDCLLRNVENQGIAKAWNHGARQAFYGHIVWINSDVVVMPGWDEALLDALHEDSRRIVFPCIDKQDGMGPQLTEGGVAGWCFGSTKLVYEEIGPFDETFSPAFYEDTDWFHRAWEHDVRLTNVMKSCVRHERRTTVNTMPWAERSNWLFLANRFRYAWKHGVDPNLPPPFYNRQLEVI